MAWQAAHIPVIVLLFAAAILYDNYTGIHHTYFRMAGIEAMTWLKHPPSNGPRLRGTP
jgi:hypothetical protein